MYQVYVVKNTSSGGYIGIPRGDWKQSEVTIDRASMYVSKSSAKRVATRKSTEVAVYSVMSWVIDEYLV